MAEKVYLVSPLPGEGTVQLIKTKAGYVRMTLRRTKCYRMGCLNNAVEKRVHSDGKALFLCEDCAEGEPYRETWVTSYLCVHGYSDMFLTPDKTAIR